MSTSKQWAWPAGAALTIALVVTGCSGNPAPDDAVVTLRQRLLVAEEPAGQRTLSELMAALEPAAFAGEGQTEADVAAADVAAAATVEENSAEEPADPPAADVASSAQPAVAPMAAGEEVWVVGRIFAGDFEPWENGQASFLISELPEQGHGAGHDADNCPFCKRKAAQTPKAMVRFRDEAGQTLAIDARKLFDIKTQDVVVVRGTATVGELNTLIIDATSLHVRR